MIDKQELVVQLLSERLSETKVGIIFKGIDGISPEAIIQRPAYGCTIADLEMKERIL